MEPARFDEMRPGCFDIDARVLDMDRAGIWASLCFPSLVSGFCGAVYSRATDQDLGLACLRAFNNWHLEVWAGTYPDRIIPLQLPWLADMAVATAEVRANAARGFKAVSFPEFPAQLRLPSIFSGAWDPFFAACEETGRWSACTPGPRRGPRCPPRPAVRAVANRVPGQRAAGRRRMAVVRRRRCGSRACRWPVRGRHRVGADADGPGRLRPRPFGLGHREHRLALGPAAERGAPAQLLVLLH